MKFCQRQAQPCPDLVPRPSDDGVPLPLPIQMIAEAARHVVGQERAKEALAGELYRHYLLLLDAAEGQGDVSFRPGRLLLVGPTGVGKTLLIEVLARYLGLPFVYASATTLVRSGYVGGKPEDILWQLVEAAGGDIDRAQHGIVMLDEIDKLKRNDDLTGPDVSGYGAQVDLLPFLDGTAMTIQRDNKTHRVDTRRVFVVAAGAFEGIDRIVERRLQEQVGFGFATSGTLREMAPERLVAEHLTPEDLVRYGLCGEFVGRFSELCTLDPLDAGALREILLHARGSPLAETKAYYALHGIDLEFDDAALDAIVARARSQGTGARALRRLLHELLADVACRLPELAAAGIGTVSATLVEGELRVRCLEAVHRPVGVPTRAERLRAERRLARPGGGKPARPAAVPFTDTRGWSDERIRTHLEELKIGLGWGETTGTARRWWETFEHEQRHQLGLVLRLAQELAARETTISEFSISYVYSNVYCIQANLHYFDYFRLKKEEERRKREKTAGEAQHRSRDTCPPRAGDAEPFESRFWQVPPPPATGPVADQSTARRTAARTKRGQPPSRSTPSRPAGEAPWDRADG